MKMTQDFAGDLAQILDAYQRGEPFAFSRFGDGEAAILYERAKPFRPQREMEQWNSHDCTPKFRQLMMDSLTADLDGYYVGVICPGMYCSRHSNKYLRERVRAPLERQTYAELFSNSNYNTVEAFDWGAANIVTCLKGAGMKYVIPENVLAPWDLDGLVGNLLRARDPILVAAGPAASVIIHQYWQRQTPELRVPIIDVGSSLDPLVHGVSTRPIHHPLAREHRRTCTWDGLNTDPPKR